MAWIDYTSGGGAEGERLAAFAQAYPNAVVVVSEVDVWRPALDFNDGTVYMIVMAAEHQKVTEYRGLTKETAEYLKAGESSFSKKRLRLTFADSTYGQHHANCPNLIGTERQCAISRANEADGNTLTVTESTTDWSSAVTGDYKEYGVTGAGETVQGDVRISWGHSA